VRSAGLVCLQRNSLRSTTYTPDDVLCEAETCRVVEGHETGVIEPGTTAKAALNTVFVNIHI
jgi:hypothetical protein